jgi:AcrR family transcriptional regulator
MASVISAAPSREAVLEAAHELLMERGYAGLSMRELAKQSGLAKGTIYHHFHDKRDIYLSVLERDILVVRARIHEAASVPGDIEDRLRNVVRTYFALQEERRLVIMMALREAASMEEQLCALIRRYRDELLEPIAAIFEGAEVSGRLRSVDVDLVVLSLFGVLQGFVTHRLLLENQEVGEDVVEHILDLFLRGVLETSSP